MFEYVDSYSLFEELCFFIKKNIDEIYIDTEFSRHYTYYPKLSLIQLLYKYNNSSYIYIIDVQKICNIDCFKKILKSKKIKKIFFSCFQDLDVFLYYTKYINNIEDIQLMMDFSGFDGSLSYDNAINKILNISFKKNKKLQSSNWESRPLTKEKLEYASNDVLYMPELYNNVLKIITEQNYKYYKNELRYILKFKDKKYLIKNSWKKSKFLLHKKTLEYVLLFKELDSWRESEAIKKNKIRNNIITDEVIDIIIKNKPKNISNLKSLYSYRDILNMKKEYKKRILNIINSFYENYNCIKSCNETFYMLEKGFIYKNKMLNIYNKVKEISKNNNIFIEKTLSKTDIIFLIMRYENKRSILYGWKYNLFKNILNIF